MFPKTLRCFWIATWTIAVVWSPAVAEADSGDVSNPLFEYRARYDVERNGRKLGELAVELSRRDDGLWHYEARSENPSWLVRLLGLETVETSWFEWRQGRIVPLTYHHVSGEPGTDRFWQHRYDWDSGRTETRTHRGEFSVPLADGVLDPLTLRLAAQATLARKGPADLRYRVLERDAVETQFYRFEDGERIVVDGRCHDTLRFHRFRREGSSRNYTAWHSRALDWVPVRIRHDADGDAITMTLAQWQSDAATLPPAGACQPSGREDDRI